MPRKTAKKSKPKKLVRVTLTLPDGKRKYFSGATRKEAEKKRDEAKLKIGCGFDLGNEMTFKQISDLWLENYSAREDLHDNTVDCARNILKNHVVPAIGNLRLKDIKPMHIDMMLRKMSGLSKSTQRKALIYAGAVFNTAVENELIPRSPLYGKKPVAKEPEKVHALTDEQCEALLKAVKGTRAYPFIVVLLFCGLRRGEALGLMWKDVDFDRKLLTVERAVTYTKDHKEGILNYAMKSDAAHRVIPMSQEVLMVLREEKAKSRSVYVFPMRNGKYLSRSSFERLWDLVRERNVANSTARDLMEKPIDFHVHPHQLRHTCCTRWIASGMNPKEVQYLMGHASVELTMSVYAEYQTQQHLESTAEKINAESLRLALG